MKNTIARDYIELTDLWDATPKSVMADNIEKFLGYSMMYRGHKDNARLMELVSITGATSHTVSAWLNRSRENVKIPLYRLCMIAESLGVDVRDLLSENASIKRDWLSVDNITARQAKMFSEINESDYFSNGIWDIESLIKDMDSKEVYDGINNMEQLKNDCLTFFSIILKVKNGIFVNTLFKSIEDYFNV